MKKNELFRILEKASDSLVSDLAKEIKEENETVIIKKPEKSLAMIKMREPVKESLFYIGEVMISEAIVAVNGIKGMAVIMGDRFEKVLNMAVIDAAINAGIFKRMEELEEAGREQIIEEEKKNALFMKTMVNFKSMDSEVQ